MQEQITRVVNSELSEYRELKSKCDLCYKAQNSIGEEGNNAREKVNDSIKYQSEVLELARIIGNEDFMNYCNLECDCEKARDYVSQLVQEMESPNQEYTGQHDHSQKIKSKQKLKI